jgi:hypothetical protein
MATSFNYTHVYAAAGFSGDSWNVTLGHNLLFTAAAGDAEFSAAGKTITLTAGTWPAWFVVGKVFSITGTTNNNLTFSVDAVVSNKIIAVRETVVDELAATPVINGSADLRIQDVLLSAGNGVLTVDAPLVLSSTGNLTAPRTLSFAGLETDDTMDMRGRILILSVQNDDILLNALTLVSSATINDAANFVVTSKGDYMFYHIANGVWRTVLLPLPTDALATFKRIPFTAAHWDAGATKDTIRVVADGVPGAGEVGPHWIEIYPTYMVQVINLDLPKPEVVTCDIMFEDDGSGDIIIEKAPRSPDFNGVVLISGTLD